MSPFKKDPSEIGALWTKVGNRGKYLTGIINGEPVVVFRNERKTEGSKQPDFRVLKAIPKDKTPVTAQSDFDEDPIPF